MALRNIDKALSNNVGDFKIATAGIDALTIKVAQTRGQKSGCQALTYLSKPIDLAIQIAAAPIFALYQTLKSIYNAFKHTGVCLGVVSVVFSPLIFAINLIKNLWSTKFISTPLNTVIPLGTLLDMNNDSYLSRTVALNEKFGIFDCVMREQEVRHFQQQRQAAIAAAQAPINANGMQAAMGGFAVIFQNFQNNLDQLQRIANGDHEGDEESVPNFVDGGVII